MDPTIISDLFGGLTPIIPMAVLIVAALLLPAVYYLTKNRHAAMAVATIAMVVSLGINVILLTGGYTGTYSGLFAYDAFSGLMMLLFQMVAVMVVFVSSSTPETTNLHFGTFLALMLVATSGMMFVAQANDLIALFVGVEAVSIPSYLMVTMKRHDTRAAEAGVKYVIIGGMSSALTLYGISMLYGTLGTLTIADLGAAMSSAGYSPMLIIGVIAMIAGYGFKIAAVPFHMWAPDVYEGASTPVSVLLATGSKKMGLAVFLKVFIVMFVAARGLGGMDIEWIRYTFAIIAAFSMTIGNIVAISQTNIKRMLAYSSIAQAGYIMIALAVMTPYAVEGGMFHMFTHVFMKAGAFLIVGALIAIGIGEKISDYRGLSKRSPFLAAAMMIFLFSLAGIPPLAGFTSKFVLFSGAIWDSPNNQIITQWIWLAFVAILNSAISLYYYVKVVKAMYFEKSESEQTDKLKIPATFTVMIVICLVGVILLGIFPDIILDPCKAAAEALFGI